LLLVFKSVVFKMSERKIMGQRSLIVLSLLLVSLTSSCSGESKKVQCDKFAKVTAQVKDTFTADEAQNKSVDKTVTPNTIEGYQKLAKDSADHMAKRAANVDRAVKIIEELSVGDKELQSLKTEYLGIIQKQADATRLIMNIYTAKSKATAKTMTEPSFKQLDKDNITAINTFTAAVTAEPKFIKRLNTYCSAK
jgi:hypothetical protein